MVDRYLCPGALRLRAELQKGPRRLGGDRVIAGTDRVHTIGIEMRILVHGTPNSAQSCWNGGPEPPDKRDDKRNWYVQVAC